MIKKKHNANMNRMLSEKCFSSFPLLFDGLRKTKNLCLEKSYTN